MHSGNSAISKELWCATLGTPLMPRFRVKDLLLSITLISLGLCALTLWRNDECWWLSIYSLPLICAGLFTPFNRMWLGAGIGCLLYPVLLILIVGGLFLWCSIQGTWPT
jgi:hypothetical protein